MTTCAGINQMRKPGCRAGIAFALAACLALPAVAGEPAEKAGKDEPALSADAGSNKVFLDGWSYSRERKTINGSNRVICHLSVKNVTEESLHDVRVGILLLTSMGETVFGPVGQILGTIKPGETKQVQTSNDFVAAFQAYQVKVTFTGGEEVWHCASDIGRPVPMVDKLQENTSEVVLLGEESGVDRRGVFAGKVRVKNIGALEAKDVQLRVTLFGAPPKTPRKAPPAKTGKAADPKKDEAPDPADGAVLLDWTGKLGDGKLAGGAEKVIPFVVPKAVPKGYASHRIRVMAEKVATEKALGGGEFQNIKDLETAHFEFKRGGEKNADLAVSFDLRNGMDTTVRNAKIVLTFNKLEKGKKKAVKTHEATVAGPIAGGQVLPVQFELKEVPEFDGFEQSLACEPVEEKAAKAPVAVAASKPAFKNTETVEVLIEDLRVESDGSALLVCKARNGRPHPVKDVVIRVHFLKSDETEVSVGEKNLPDPIPHGEVRNFVLRASGTQGFDHYKSEVKFAEIAPKPAAASAENPPEAPAAPDDAKSEAPAAENKTE